MGKVSVKIQGGLGNMLFQIACAYTYSLKNNKELVLSLRDSVVVHKHLNEYRSNLLHKVNFVDQAFFNDYKVYNEPGFHYLEPSYMDANVYLNGYFQSELYFKDFEEKIRETFSFPQNCIDTIKERYKDVLDKNTCSIHVRRGDYLNSPNHHPTQSMAYYTKAIKRMPKDSLFLIFSDDIDWCKNNFPDAPEKFIFINGNVDHEDFLLMSMCKNNIICNSTFSWWAAWLNNNKEKVVVSPSCLNWFGNAYSHYNTSDIIPKDWIQIQ